MGTYHVRKWQALGSVISIYRFWES